MSISHEFAAALAEKFGEDISVQEGGKYDRIVRTSYGQRSVHAFARFVFRQGNADHAGR